MAENEKDNKDFEFIKEQVIEKKRKKIKKRLLPILMTIFLAILFGLIAAVTFAITEPGIYSFLHKEEATKTPISFPTPSPEVPTPQITEIPEVTPTGAASIDTTGTTDPAEVVQPRPTPVVQRIDASLDDFTKMYGEMSLVAYSVNKSIVDVSSTFTVIDWFNKPVEKIVETTGVIVADNTADLLILVSLDRVKDADSIRIKFSDTVYVDAVLQDYESDINLALLAIAKLDIPQIQIANLQVATLGESYTTTVGSPVIALGSPNGHSNSMEFGIITSKGSYVVITDNKLDLFNTDIADNPNSDGIIINLEGKIIGLITRTLKEDVNEELSTVIGISKIQSYIEKMGNQDPRIYFGIKAEDMTESALTEHNMTNGIYVSEVLADSPAFEAGMKSGDIIQFINNQTVANTNYFYNYISTMKPDDEITVKIKRTSGTTEKDMDLPVVLAEKVQ